MASKLSRDTRPSWPRRAIVTAGMPYGNKNLHFGHVGGVFIPADFFARFLRDRLGAENVLFVSGTDCYGSPIMESYRKLREEGYDKSIGAYVQENHDRQEATLDAYDISCDLYAGPRARRARARAGDRRDPPPPEGRRSAQQALDAAVL